MMNLELEKEQLLSSTYFELTSELNIDNRDEKIEAITSTLNKAYTDADAYGLDAEAKMLLDIKQRVFDLKKMVKKHKVDDRLNTIVKNIKW